VQAWNDVFVAARTETHKNINGFEALVPRDTPHGVLLTVASHRVLEDHGLTLVPIVGGDYEAVKRDLFYRLTLKRLSCTPPRLPLSLAPSDLRAAEAAFVSQYRLLADEPPTDVARLVAQLVAAVRAQLRQLGQRALHKAASASDVWFDEALAHALYAFQQSYNRALEQQLAQPDAPAVRFLDGSGRLDLATLDALCHQSAEFRNGLADSGFRTTPALAVITGTADTDAGRRVERATHFFDKKMTRVLEAPRALSRQISNSLHKQHDAADAETGTSPPDMPTSPPSSSMLEKLRKLGPMVRSQSSRPNPVRTAATIDSTAANNVFERRAERSRQLAEALRSSDDSALQLSHEVPLSPPPEPAQALSTTSSQSKLTVPSEPVERRRRRSSSVSNVPSPRKSDDALSPLSLLLESVGRFDGEASGAKFVPPALPEASAAPSSYRVSDEVRERVGFVDWRDAAEAALGDERAPFSSPDQRLCDWAASMQLVTLERWDANALAGYQLYVINALAAESEPRARIVLQQVASRRYRVAAGVMRAKPHLSQMQRQQLIALFFRPVLPQIAALGVVREASLIGFVGNVFVPSVAEDYAALSGAPALDIVPAFRDAGVPITPSLSDDLPLVLRELALLVSLQRLGCVAPSSVASAASLDERLRGARRLLHADYAPWLRASHASGQDALVDALADDVATIVTPLRHALRRLLALAPPASSDSEPTDPPFVDQELLAGVRLHAERSDCGGERESLITPAFIELVYEQLTALKYEFASCDIAAPRDPFASFEAMAAATEDFREQSGKDYAAVVRNVIASIAQQRAGANASAVASSRASPEMSMLSSGEELLPPPPAQQQQRPLLRRVEATDALVRVDDDVVRTVPAPVPRAHARREPLGETRRDSMALQQVADLRAQIALLQSQRGEELTQAALLWQERFLQLQRDMKTIESEFQRARDANASLETELEAARTHNATLKRQLYTTLELINGHAERVDSYKVKVAVLEQTVDSVEKVHKSGFVQQFVWALGTSFLSLLTMTIAAGSSLVHVVSAKLRGRPVDSRATLAKALQMEDDGADAAATGGEPAPSSSSSSSVDSTSAPATTAKMRASPATKFFPSRPTALASNGADDDGGDDGAAIQLPPPLNTRVAAVTDDGALRNRRPKSNSTSTKPKLSDFIDDIEFGAS
jgi:hypothetical protein